MSRRGRRTPVVSFIDAPWPDGTTTTWAWAAATVSECAIRAHGFARLRCGECGHDKLPAFSCKRRGFCPSCSGRMMSKTAAHRAGHLMPDVPVRQGVLSPPLPLRVLPAVQPGEAPCHARRRRASPGTPTSTDSAWTRPLGAPNGRIWAYRLWQQGARWRAEEGGQSARELRRVRNRLASRGGRAGGSSDTPPVARQRLRGPVGWGGLRSEVKGEPPAEGWRRRT